MKWMMMMMMRYIKIDLCSIQMRMKMKWKKKKKKKNELQVVAVRSYDVLMRYLPLKLRSLLPFRVFLESPEGELHGQSSLQHAQLGRLEYCFPLTSHDQL